MSVNLLELCADCNHNQACHWLQDDGSRGACGAAGRGAVSRPWLQRPCACQAFRAIERLQKGAIDSDGDLD